MKIYGGLAGGNSFDRSPKLPSRLLLGSSLAGNYEARNDNLHIKSPFSLPRSLALRFLRVSGIEHYTGFSPFTASTALYNSEPSENSQREY